MFSISRDRRFNEIGKAVLVLLLVTFIAHFIFFPFFGIYEDDYFYALPTMNSSWQDFRQALVDAWLHPVQARPLNHFLRHICFFFTIRHGQLEAGYLLSWALVSANAIALFALIRRILPYVPALVGALIFVLFPLDTSRQILMHQTDLLMSIFLLLVCFHFYLSRRYWVAYVVLAISLLNYEAMFPVFLVAPLLAAAVTGVRWKSLFQRLILHAVILGILFGLLVLARLLLGEERARDVSSNPVATILRMVRLCTEGPWHGLEALILRPIDAAIHPNPSLVPFIILSIGLIGWGLNHAGSKEATGADASSSKELGRTAVLIVFLGGVLAWSLSYILWLPDDFFPPVVGIGRLTGEHSAAAIGAGLVAASVAAWIVSLSFSLKKLFAFLFCCYCGALVGFGTHIQLAEYIPYWQETKRFWSDLLNQIRDVQEGEPILVEQSADARVMAVTQGFPEFDEESYFPLALPTFVDFPKTWKDVPRVYGVWKGCGSDDLGDSIKVHTPMWGPGIWPVIHPGNFIYFRAVNGRLQRATDSVTIEGKILQPKAPPAEDLPPLPLSKTYLNLVSPPDEKTWLTLRNARNYPH